MCADLTNIPPLSPLFQNRDKIEKQERADQKEKDYAREDLLSQRRMDHEIALANIQYGNRDSLRAQNAGNRNRQRSNLVG
tara:strand:- start:3024 stop:3263 length:240 start_codon:yes stop_codon:yes gene_type:complete